MESYKNQRERQPPTAPPGEGCRSGLCLGMVRSWLGENRQKKVKGSKEPRRGSVLLSPLAGGELQRSAKRPRRTAFIHCQRNSTKPNNTSKAKYFPEPPLFRPQTSPLRRCSQQRATEKK